MISSPSRLAAAIVVGVLVVSCSPTASPAPVTTPAASGLPPSAPAAATPNSTPIVSPTATPSEAAVWLDAGDLVEPRSAAHVVVLGTGEVLVVGSDWMTSWLATCGTATAGSDSAEIGDPLARVWKKTASLPSRREAPVLVALPDGRALLTGGMTGEDGGPAAYSSTYIFDPATKSWTRSGLLNTARTGAAAAVLPDGRVLVAGGLYIDQAQNQRDLDSSELWDSTAGNWSRTGPLAGTRINASAATLADGRVLVVGGVANNGDEIQLAAAEVYDPESGRWSAAGTLAVARSGFALVALADGGAIVAGGFGPAARAIGRLSTVERFDPVANTWSAARDFPGPVAGATGIRLADGRVLLAGGSAREPRPIDPDAGTYVTGLAADAALFDPATGEWTVTTPMPSARAGASAVLLADGSALFAGGSASEGDINGTPGCPVAEPQVVRYVPGS